MDDMSSPRRLGRPRSRSRDVLFRHRRRARNAVALACAHAESEMPAFILRPPSVLVDANGDRMASSPVTLSPSGRPSPPVDAQQ